MELGKLDEPDFRIKILAIQLPHNFFLILWQNLIHFGAQHSSSSAKWVQSLMEYVLGACYL